MKAEKFACACCGYKTFDREDNSWEICPVCYWESDPIQNTDTAYKGGANKISLIEAQKNFILFGACDACSVLSVRPPKHDEPKDENWEINRIQKILEWLPVKKKWHTNNDGNKVKVVRNAENKYSVYHNGHFVNEEADWQQAFEMVKALLISK
jgi:Cysteine-rich CPCC